MSRDASMKRHGGPDNERALAALLDYIARERDRRRERILGGAREEADGLVRDARRKARQRVSEEVERAREERRSRLQSARATTDSRVRQRQHEIARARLDKAWALLERTLAERWADPEARREWIAMALEAAARHLPAGTWTLEHAGDGDDPGDADEAFATLRERRPDVEVECVGEPGLKGGLRVEVANAVLDASVEALLARRTHVEGLLLGALREGAGVPADARAAGARS